MIISRKKHCRTQHQLRKGRLPYWSDNLRLRWLGRPRRYGHGSEVASLPYNSDSLRINNYWICKSGQKLESPVLGVYCHMTANRLSKHCPRTKLLSSVNIFNPKLWDVSFTKQTSQSPVSDVKVKVLFAFDRFKTNWNKLKLEMLLCSKTVFLGKITFTDTVALSTKKSGQL